MVGREAQEGVGSPSGVAGGEGGEMARRTQRPSTPSVGRSGGTDRRARGERSPGEAKFELEVARAQRGEEPSDMTRRLADDGYCYCAAASCRVLRINI